MSATESRDRRKAALERQYSQRSNSNSIPSSVAASGGAVPASPSSSPHRNVPIINRRTEFQKQLSERLSQQSLNAAAAVDGETGKRSSSLRHVLEANEYVDVVTPVHWGPARSAIVKETLKPKRLVPPVQDIRNYYGEDVAFYFAWMGTLSQWLTVLGFMGLVTHIVRWYRGDSLDEDEYTPMYGLFTFVWGVLFLRFWQRHEHRLAYRWGTYSPSLYDKQKNMATRPEFHGELRISPITGNYETYYPTNMRRMKYLVSGLVTIVMLSIAFCMMILSLNMQGFIHRTYSILLHMIESGSLLYVYFTIC